MDDILDLMYGNDEDAAMAKAKAMASALRGQKALGMIGQIAGGRLAAPGKSIAGDAENQEGELLRVPAMRQGLAKGKADLGQAELERSQKNSADSYRSQFARALAQKFGKSIPGFQVGSGATAAELEPGMNNAEKSYAVDENDAIKRLLLSQKQATTGANGGLKPKDIEGEFKRLGENLSTYKGRANLNKENQARLNSAERLEALILGPDGQIQNLTPQQMSEAAMSLGNLIAQGHVTVGQLEELNPQTGASKWANIKQYLTNKPQGADAQAFLRNMLDTSAREKRTVLQQMRKGQEQGLPEFSHLRGVQKARYDSMLKGAGLDPAAYDEAGLPLAPVAAPAAPAGVERKTLKGHTYEKRADGWHKVD